MCFDVFLKVQIILLISHVNGLSSTMIIQSDKASKIAYNYIFQHIMLAGGSVINLFVICITFQ